MPWSELKSILQPNPKNSKTSFSNSNAQFSSCRRGVYKRFAEDLIDRDLRIAAIWHPSFKLSWVPDDEKETLENIFRDAVSDLKESLDRNNGQSSITNK